MAAKASLPSQTMSSPAGPGPPTAVAELDDQELLRVAAAKRGMKVYQLEGVLNEKRGGPSVREKLALLEAEEKQRNEAEAAARKKRIAGAAEVRESHERIIRDGAQEAARLMVWLARKDKQDPTNVGLARFRAAIAQGLLARLRALAHEAGPVDLSGIEV